MSNTYRFQCQFCGKDFGSDVVELALHIGKIHDKPRNAFTWEHITNQLQMNCNNKSGCHHDNSIHEDGNGKCLVRGCKCEKFEIKD